MPYEACISMNCMAQYTYICVYVYMHICIYIYIYIYIHMYIYTHIVYAFSIIGTSASLAAWGLSLLSSSLTSLLSGRGGRFSSMCLSQRVRNGWRDGPCYYWEWALCMYIMQIILCMFYYVCMSLYLILCMSMYVYAFYVCQQPHVYQGCYVHYANYAWYVFYI